MSNSLVIRNMARAEVDELVDWAASEGWNPGLHDADIFWETDSEAFIAADLDHELIGGGAITSYGGRFGFMGFFIVRPEFRGRGLGNTIWHARLERLVSRLHSGAIIGMDGVFDMQDYYARGGFVFSHRNLRYRKDIPAQVDIADDYDAQVLALEEIPFEQVSAYDCSCFPTARDGFLKSWVSQPEARALVFIEAGELRGYGVVRRCREGCKIGPLFADDALIANALYQRLAAFAAGGPLFLDAPENNPAAIGLVQQHAMEEVFGCARMYLGPFPEIEQARIFGVTTFELG